MDYISRLNDMLKSKHDGKQDESDFMQKLRRQAGYDDSYSKVDQSYVNSFVRDSQGYLSSMQENTKRLSGSNATKEYENYSSRLSDLRSKADNIRSYYNAHKKEMDEQFYQNMIDYLDEFDTSSNTLFDFYRESSEKYNRGSNQKGSEAFDKNNFKNPIDVYQFLSSKDYTNYTDKEIDKEFDEAMFYIGGAKERAEKSAEDVQAVTDPSSVLTGLPRQKRVQEELLNFNNAKPNTVEVENENKNFRDVLNDIQNTKNKNALKNNLSSAVGNIENHKPNQELLSPLEISQNRVNELNDIYQNTLALKNQKKQDKYMTMANEDENFAAYVQEAKTEVDWDQDKISEIKSHPKYQRVYNQVELAFSNRDKNLNLNISDLAPEYLLTMSEDERNTYDYHYITGGKHTADQYLDTIKEELKQRQGKIEAEELLNEKGPIARTAYAGKASIDAAISEIKGIPNALHLSYDPMERTESEYAYQNMRQELSGTEAIISDLVYNTGRMTPSIAASLVNPKLGLAVAGLQSASAAYDSAVSEGYSPNEALAYGTANGISESLSQYLLGGINAFGNSAVGKAIGKTKLTSQLDDITKKLIKNPVARQRLLNIAKYGTEMHSEGMEEYFQEIIDPLVRNITLGEDNELSLVNEDAAYAYLLGALTAGTLNAPYAALNESSLRSEGRKIKSSGEEQQTIQRGLESDQGSKAWELAQDISKKQAAGKTPSDYEVGLLGSYLQEERTQKQAAPEQEMELEPSENTGGEITLNPDTYAQTQTRLTEMGVDKQAAAVQAKAIERLKLGDTSAIHTILESPEAKQLLARDTGVVFGTTPEQGRRAAGEIAARAQSQAGRIRQEIQPEQAASTVRQNDQQQTDTSAMQPMDHMTERETATAILPAESPALQPQTASAQQGFVPDPVMESGQSAPLKTVSEVRKPQAVWADFGEPVQVTGIQSAQNGELYVRADSDSGSTVVRASDLSYQSPEVELIYQTAAQLGTSGAKAFVYGYQPGSSFDSYYKGFMRAYHAGTANTPFEQIGSAYTAMLPKETARRAYYAGQNDQTERFTNAGERSTIKKSPQRKTVKKTKNATYTYQTVAPENYSERAAEIKKDFERWGIEAAVTQGPIEVTNNQGKIRIYNQAGKEYTAEAATVEDGSILINNNIDPSLDHREYSAHELLHRLLKLKNKKAQNFYDVVTDGNIDFLSDEFQKYSYDIYERYRNNTDTAYMDFLETKLFLNEFSAFVSGALYHNESHSISKHKAMFINWDTVVDAWLDMMETVEGGIRNERQTGKDSGRDQNDSSILWGRSGQRAGTDRGTDGRSTERVHDDAEETRRTSAHERGRPGGLQENARERTGGNVRVDGGHTLLGLESSEAERGAGKGRKQDGQGLETDRTTLWMQPQKAEQNVGREGTGIERSIENDAEKTGRTPEAESGRPRSIPQVEREGRPGNEGISGQRSLLGLESSEAEGGAGKGRKQDDARGMVGKIGERDGSIQWEENRGHSDDTGRGSRVESPMAGNGEIIAEEAGRTPAHERRGSGGLPENAGSRVGENEERSGRLRIGSVDRRTGRGQQGQTTGLAQNEAAKKLKGSQRAYLHVLGKLSNSRIVLDDTIQGGRANGYYDLDTGEIHIALDAVDSAYDFVAKHELTHQLQQLSPEHYRQYFDHVVSYLNQAEPDAFDKLVQKQLDGYREMGKKITRQQAMDEVVADASDAFLRDSAAIRDLVSQNRTLGQKVLDAIRSMIRKIDQYLRTHKTLHTDAARLLSRNKKALEEAQRLWTNALLSAQKNTARKNSSADGDVRFSKKLGGYNPDISVSTKDIQIFKIQDIKNIKEVKQKVYNYLKQSYISTEDLHKPIVNIDTGMSIEIRRKGINETFGNDKAYHLLSTENKKIKLATMTSLAKMIKYGEVRSAEAANYHNPNSSVTFAYLTSPITIDGKNYQVEMDIRKAAEGNQFYIHKIKIADEAPKHENQSPAKLNTSSATTNIPQEDTGVNDSISKNDKNVRFSIKRDADGSRYVQVDEDILEGVPQKDWVKVVKNNLTQKFPDGVSIGNELIKVTSRSRKELTMSVYSQNAAKFHKLKFHDKMAATNYLDELVKISEDYVGEGLKHLRKDDFIEFARGTTKFKIGENGYTAEIIVGITKKQNTVLYDIVNLKREDIQKKEIKKVEVTNTAMVQTNAHRDRSVTSTTTNVSQKDTGVNSIISENDKNVLFSINPNFTREYDAWDKKQVGFSFVVGKTSEALKNVGVKDQTIRWDASKIIKIKNKHSGMTDQVIKQVPRILETPIIVMESKNNASRITVFGEIYDDDQKPVLAVLELSPTSNKGVILDQIKLASAYGKDNIQNFINSSKILYIEPDKKRTDNWLNVNRLQLPLRSTNYGSNNRISYDNDSVNSSISDARDKNTEKHFSLKNVSKLDYETLVSKPDMKITPITYSQQSKLEKSRSEIVDTAVKNARMLGKENRNGNVVVHVKDIDTDIIISKAAIRHGLDRRKAIQTPIVEHIGEVITNSVLINELAPKNQYADSSYILLGIAKIDTENNYSLVRSVVNRFTNELETMDVLYSVDIKKESAASKEARASGTNTLQSLTDSTISVADFLSIVKDTYPDILPQSVLDHYGRERTEGIFTNSLKFSLKNVSKLESENLIERYTQTEYNDYGWVAVNEVLTPSELRKLNTQFADMLHGEKFSKNRDGYYIIPVGEENRPQNSFVFIKGTISHPKISQILRIDVENEAELDIIRGDFGERRNFESREIIEAIYGQETVYQYSAGDFEDYQTLRNQGQTAGLRRNAGSNRGVSDGGRDQSGNLGSLQDKDQVTFSLKNVSKLDYDNLIKENKKQKEMISLLEEQFQVTKGIKWDKASIDRTAQRILKQYDSTYSVQDLSENLTSLYGYLKNNPDTNTDEVHSVVTAMSKSVLEHSRKLDDAMYQEYKELRDRIRGTRLTLSDADKADLDRAGGYHQFRRDNFGRLNLTNQGIPVDVFYQELQTLYPEFFAGEEIAHPADQLIRIAEVLDTIRPVYVNPYGMNLDEAAGVLANELLESYVDIPQAKPTYADRELQKRKKLKLEYQKKIREIKAEYKAKYEEKLKEVNRQNILNIRKIQEQLKKTAAADRETIKKLERQVERLKKYNQNITHAKTAAMSVSPVTSVSVPVKKSDSSVPTQFIMEPKKEDIAERAGGAKHGSGLSPTDNVFHSSINQAGAKIKQMADAYGTIPKGESPVRDVAVPAQTGENARVRQFARTAIEAGATPDGMISEFEREILNGAFDYNPISDKTAQREAELTLSKKGFDGALKQWKGALKNQKAASKDDIVLAEKLYVQAAKEGNYKLAMELAAEIAEEGTRAGQTVQAMRLLNKMSGEGQLVYIERTVDRMNQDLKSRREKGKAPYLEIPQEMKETLLQSKTREEIDRAAEDIYRQLASRLPVTFADKWNAWRYLSMLGNPRTHVRNLTGNAVFLPAVKMKNLIATGLEHVYRKAGGEIERTKAFRATKESLDFAKKDYEIMADIIAGGGKMNPSDVIRDYQKIFPFKTLEKARKFNFNALEAEDRIFLKRYYVSALAGYMTANQIDPNAFVSQQILERARNYAIQEAQKATYRDASKVAGMLQHLSKTNSALGLLVEGVLPFKKTPVNILKRGVEYSPAGLLYSLTMGAKKVKTGKITAAEYIDSIASGLSGTVLFALGALLQSLGILRGGEDDDKKKEQFDRNMGYQPYSLQIGDISYTIDWLAPSSLPLFVGARVFETLTEEQEDYSVSSFAEDLQMIAEPVLSLSMLSGLNDTLSSVSYGDNGISDIAANVLASYFGQAVPTLFGQAARTVDGTRRTTYTDKNMDIPSDLQYFFQKNQNKIPAASMLSQPYIDLWGREDTQENILIRAFENFVSPGYLNAVETSAVEQELVFIYEETGDAGVFPSKAAKYFQVDGQRKDLTAQEYTMFAKAKGQKAYSLLWEMMATQAYREASAQEKAELIADVYEYATVFGKTQVSAYSTNGWKAKALQADQNGESVVEVILNRKRG
ncbi:MuF-C-terminal domain-containing protein [Massiliimalia timonensis]|uniref:MuF-C-terminal domain-containing protein n=1 Tax=Massiliimalia timonensis TaxID=1987501 RepID=UPI0018A029EB|nr:hypothetical protein [Massiliimalia timonensis]